MIKPIAEFVVSEKYNDQFYPTSMNLFKETDKIRIIKIQDGERIRIYENTVKEFLKKMEE